MSAHGLPFIVLGTVAWALPVLPALALPGPLVSETQQGVAHQAEWERVLPSKSRPHKMSYR